MRILVVPSWYPSAQRPERGVFFEAHARALASAGHDVTAIAVELGSITQPHEGAFGRGQIVKHHDPLTGLRTYRLLAWNWAAGSRYSHVPWLRAAARLSREYINERGTPDLVHAHGTLWAGVAGMSLRRQTGIPYVITEHSSTVHTHAVPAGFRQRILKRSLHHAAAVTAVSRSLATALELYTGNAVSVIPNVVDTAFFTLPPSPRTFDPHVFLFVGVLVPQKNVAGLIEAFAACRRARPHAELHIVGEGPERPRLERLTGRLGVAASVRFLGRQGRLGVREAMWASNTLILNSDAETFGVVLIEASATGLPFITTSSGGPRDVADAGLGTVVRPGDTSQLASAMIEAADRGSREPGPIRDATIKHFAPARVVSQLDQVYMAAVGSQ